MAVTRASDRDLAHHATLMESVGRSRGLKAADVEAVVTAYRGGAIRAEYGHQLIAGLPGTPLPRSIAAFASSASAPVPIAASRQMPRREFTDTALRVVANGAGCPEAQYFAIMSDLCAGKVTETQAIDRLKEAGRAARQAELATSAPRPASAAERQSEQAAADVLVKAYLKGDSAAIAAVRAANPEPEPGSNDISAEQLEAYFENKRAAGHSTRTRS